MRPEDFATGYPGSLATIAEGYCAFVPSKLPPAFACEADLLFEIDEAMLALGELRAIIPYMPNPQLITYPFLRREAVLSSKIEGTHTELEQLYLFEVESHDNPQKDNETERDAREVHNYVLALQHGLEQLKTIPICNRLLREMHNRLLDGVDKDRGRYKNPGSFRIDQAYIGSLDLAAARYVPPPPSFIEDLMMDLETYVHSSPKFHQTLVRIAIAHYQFEAIHPFSDGNGRVGRLLISLLLASLKVLPEPLLYLSAYFERNVDEYRQRLWQVSCRGDWLGWVQFFVRGVREVAQDATKRAKAVLDLREEYRKALQGKRGSASPIALLDQLFEFPFISAQLAAETLSVSYNSGKANIDKLIAAGILIPYGDRSWNRLYCARRLLDVLNKQDT